jgi:hypothetical protein
MKNSRFDREKHIFLQADVRVFPIISVEVLSVTQNIGFLTVSLCLVCKLKVDIII